jgi:hypothetical protein
MQAKNFSVALANGDPDEVGVIRGAARQVLETVLPDKEQASPYHLEASRRCKKETTKLSLLALISSWRS